MLKFAEKPKFWETFNGRVVPVSEMTQQHLSNVYWFHMLLCDIQYLWIFDVLKEMFDGQLLMYRPLIHFRNEILELGRKGMLEPVSFNRIHVMYEGKIVGEIVGDNSSYNMRPLLNVSSLMLKK